MIKVDTITNTDNVADTYKVALFADTKAEVATTPLSEIVGFPKDGLIEMGSSVITASGEFAFMKSDGSWNWIQ